MLHKLKDSLKCLDSNDEVFFFFVVFSFSLQTYDLIEMTNKWTNIGNDLHSIE